MPQTHSDILNETCFPSSLSGYVERWAAGVLHFMHQTTSPLRHTRLARRLRRSLSKEQYGPETLLIPVVFATKLGNVLPSTTVFDLIRQAVCRLSNVSHGDPAGPVAGGPSPPELCDGPEVVRNFATVTTILGVIAGVTSMVGCGVLSRISPHYGRKPAFLFILIMGMTWSCLIAVSQLMPDRISHWVFFLGMLFHAFSDALPFGYLVNMYIVDVCDSEDRTAMLSKMGGWTALGACIPLALGGSITTKTGNPLIVFYIAIAIFVSTFVYAVSVLPETFPEDKRYARSHVRLESSIDEIPTTARSASMLLVFEPLKMLIPTRTLGGTRNWRLTWCAAHSFVFVMAQPFSSSAWLVLVTSKYHLTPADIGIFFTVVAASNTIVLTVIVPPLVRFLRPYYCRRIKHSPLADEGSVGSEEPELGTLDRLDIHLAFVSCVFAAIFFLCAASSTTTFALITSAVFVGLSYMHIPTIRSLVVGSVDPLKQDDAMAAIEMVDSASRVLSPIIMGSVLSATIDAAPQLLFYVHLGVISMSVGLLLCIR